MKTMFDLSRQYRLRMCGMLAAGVLTASVLAAQSPLARIHNDVNASQTTVLRGSQHPLANPQSDAGRMPAGTRMNGMTLSFSRSAKQKAELDALIAAQQDPASPQYHKWITPDQFAARFGLAQSDIGKVRAWLQQAGFSIDSVMRSATGIRFSGTAAQVESAFHTELHYYAVGGERHFAPSTGLSVPSALADVVAGVRNLDDFRPKAQHVTARRNFTSATSGNVYFAPGDIATTYDIKPLYSAGFDGAGQTIAIMGQSFVDIGDVEAFQHAAGLTKKDPQMVLVPGTGNDGTPFQGDQSESDLDLEWSSAIAPGANVVFVYTGSDSNASVFDSTQYAVDNLLGNIISLSYSVCELNINSTIYTQVDQIFQQGAAQGQTIMAASGDQGSTACFVRNPPQAGDPPLATQESLAVNYPASSAYVTGVGGTEIGSGDGAGNANYWSTASGTDVINSAKKYIPEIVWNDDDPSFGLGATGGGTSVLVDRPSWQKNVPGIPSGTKRLVPDIAFYSSAGAPGYLYCTSDTSAWNTGQTSSCTSGFRDNSSGLLTVAGGTSFATPIFAGMVALLNQNGGYVSGSGEVNTALYGLAANSATYAAVFHDVTSGDNKCSAGSNFCSGPIGYSANAGYDQVTGLGSVDLALLAHVWPMSTSTLIGTDVAVQPASATVAAGTNDIVTITVSSQTGATIPTGKVTLQIDGGTAWGAGGTTITDQPLGANGQVTYTANFSTAGTHQVLAQYAGDATHVAASGVAAIVVTGGGAGKTFKVAATDVSANRGSTGVSTITVTPSGGYTGTVLLSIDFGSADSTLGNLCYSFPTMDNNGRGTVQVTGAAAVTTQLSLDTNASDCASAAVMTTKGNVRPLKLSSSAGHASNKPERRGGLPASLAFAGLLVAGLLGRRSRKLRNLACVIALLAAGFALNACGSSSSSGPSDPPKGTYTGTIVGTDSVSSTITSQTTFTFKIN